MEIIKRGQIKNYARCEHCGTEMIFDAKDLRWSHTESDCYYVICPVCKGVVWLKGTPELDAMWASIHRKA